MAAVETFDFRGTEAVRLATPAGTSAVIALHGAQVLSWQPAGGMERLYLSERAVFAEGKAIRGGVPVIFPQFAERGPGPRHGFARTRRWQATGVRQQENYASATFRLEHDEVTRALWPHAFAAELTVMIESQRLDIELEVFNLDSRPFQFTAALHTYLRLGNVELARLQGLEGLHYLDSLQGDKRCSDDRYALLVDDVVDRIYLRADKPLLLSEPGQQVAIEQSGFTDAVIWNPWQAGCAATPDMASIDFKRMLCVEAAVIENPVVVAPGEDWCGRQTLISI